MKRIHNLDYLRGLAAFSIMIYHYFTWTFGVYSSENLLGRIGIYGVSVFYVLSGLTLNLVYSNKLELNKESLYNFFNKRFFRIYPLLWIATFSSIIFLGAWRGINSFILNVTGLFGLIRWNNYIATGAWSIGNELVFYLFFPLFIFSLKKSKTFFLVLSLLIFTFYIYFAFGVLKPEVTLPSQWRNYINPLNQVFLFLGGFIIAALFKKIKISPYINVSLLLAALFLFTFYKVSGNTILLVTGWNRLFFTALCFLICFCFYKLTHPFPVFIDKPLSALGEQSYSVYLLHPIVFNIIIKGKKPFEQNLFHLSPLVWILLSVSVTLIVSRYTYLKFEKFFMHLSQRFSLFRVIQRKVQA